MDSLGAGRCPNGFVSKFCFRWASEEPVTTILDPKQAPGQCPLVRLNLQCVAKSDIGLLDTQDIALLETQDMVLLRPKTLLLVRPKTLLLLIPETLILLRPKTFLLLNPETLLFLRPNHGCNFLCRNQRVLLV